MILALISIGILAFLLFSLYGSRQDAAERELAEETLGHIVQEINAGATQVEIYNPEGWWLISWPHEGLIPNSCSNLGWGDCLCIFEKRFWTYTGYDVEKYSEDSTEGVCLEVSSMISLEGGDDGLGEVKIVNPPLVLSIEHGEEIVVRKN